MVQSSDQVLYSCNSSAVCGCSTNSASVTRIVGGQNANESTWGWAVSINISNTRLCGGSIISSSWVITAAHCMVNTIASKVSIHAGSIIKWDGTQNRLASRIIVHPNYNDNTDENDIALIQLATPLIMRDPTISPICIPSVSSAILSLNEWPSAGTSVVTVGWGRIYEGSTASRILQQVTLSTIDYHVSTCTRVIKNVRLQLCAGVSGGGKDTCQGDSGGPLMMFTSSNQWVLVGLTSYGIGCASPSYSGVYTRVVAYKDWINSYIVASHANTIEMSLLSVLIFVIFGELIVLF